MRLSTFCGLHRDTEQLGYQRADLILMRSLRGAIEILLGSGRHVVTFGMKFSTFSAIF
jgi:hypothetical protein